MPPAAEESDIGSVEAPERRDRSAGEATAGSCPGDRRDHRAFDHGGADGVVRLRVLEVEREMSIAFSQASSARIEAARQEGAANAARQADLSIWGVYVQARAQGDTALATYVERRFTPHFQVAYRAWIDQREPTTGPFKMKEYVPPGTTEAAAADQRADSRFADALRNNQRADNYTILTVLFALVLFFAAASTRLGRPRAQWVLLGVAITFLVIAIAVLATYPINF